MGHSLEQHKDFIDNEMLLVLAQMDRPSRVFPHIYLVGMGRAVGYRYSRPSHSITAVVGLRVECGQPGGAAAELVSRGGRGVRRRRWWAMGRGHGLNASCPTV